MNINYIQPLGVIDKETYRYLSLTKAYPQRSFLCDSCGVEYSSATFYSLAYHESELPHMRIYCENCLKATPKGQKRCRLKNKKLMPRIDKPKRKTKSLSKNKIKPALVVVPTAQTKTASKTSKRSPKSSPAEYYNCLMNYAQQGFYDPSESKKLKIHACCKKCKQNAPALNSEKDKELVKLITSYKQVGDSLAKLLKPIK